MVTSVPYVPWPILPPLKNRHKTHMFSWLSRPFSPSNPLSLLNLIFHFHPFPIKIIPLIPPSRLLSMAQLPPAFRSVRGVCPRLRRRGARGARKAGPRSTSKAPATATARRRKTMAGPHPEAGSWWDLTGFWRIVLGILQHKMMFWDGTSLGDVVSIYKWVGFCDLSRWFCGMW